MYKKINRIHELKIKKEYFNAIDSYEKSFEYRKDDRGYKVGDLLALNEIDEDGNYTGNAMLVEIIYIFRGEEGIPLPNNYIIMEFRRCSLQYN